MCLLPCPLAVCFHLMIQMGISLADIFRGCWMRSTWSMLSTICFAILPGYG